MHNRERKKILLTIKNIIIKEHHFMHNPDQKKKNHNKRTLFHA